MDDRPDWNDYFAQLTRLVATRSTCRRRKVGAILVRDRRILTTGYNGAPQGLEHCLDTGCLREDMSIPSGQRQELCRAIHAEQNAVIQAARHGISTVGADLYCTTQPCVTCSKILINAGVKRVYCLEDYDDDLSLEMLKQAHVDLIKMESP